MLGCPYIRALILFLLRHKRTLTRAVARQQDLLSVEYYHLVFTLPAPIGDLAYYNKAVVYQILFQAAARTLCIIARDP